MPPIWRGRLLNIAIAFLCTSCVTSSPVYEPKSFLNPGGYQGKKIAKNQYKVGFVLITEEITNEVLKRHSAEITKDNGKEYFSILNAKNIYLSSGVQGMGGTSSRWFEILLLNKEKASNYKSDYTYNADTILKETEYLLNKKFSDYTKYYWERD